jgi:CarD family transcriptional regulator
MFEIGDKVVYPMQGVGIIEKIEEKTILQKKRKYYIMKLSVSDMTVMIPCDMAEKVGVRGVVEYPEIEKAIELLKENPSLVEENWKARYSNNHGKVKSGSIMELAEVVRNLYRRNKIKELSSSEKKLFENALQLLVDEIALSKGLEKVEVEHLITETLEEGVPGELQEVS